MKVKPHKDSDILYFAFLLIALAVGGLYVMDAWGARQMIDYILLGR